LKFLKLQPLTSAQLDQIVALDRISLGGLWSSDGYQREIDSPNSDLLVLHKIEHPDSIQTTALIGMGCVWAIADEAHITLLATHPDYRQQGLGQLMLYALLLNAWKRNLAWATLEVRLSNQRAIALYEKFGFQRVGTRPKYYQDPVEDALILWHNGLKHHDFVQTLHQWYRAASDRLMQSEWKLLTPDYILVGNQQLNNRQTS
jgi:[ribosomal protein S18]-alanine N-acetyltransferase